MSEIAAYKEALKAAVGAAIDSGLYYNRDVDAFVEKHCSVPDPAKEAFLGIVDLPVHDLPAARKVSEDLAVRIAAAPRGTWALVRKAFENGGGTRTVYQAHLSDGSGALAPGGRTDSWSEPPAFAAVMRRAFEMEVYLARQELEGERLAAKNREAIESGRVALGSEFRDVAINQQRFSRVKVVGVDAEAGTVSLELTKRGTRRRWKCDVGAAALSPAPAPADRAEEADAPSP